jgi:hypothetical protein
MLHGMRANEREDNGRVMVKDRQTHHLEGETMATPWRLESVFPHDNRRLSKAAVSRRLVKYVVKNRLP